MLARKAARRAAALHACSACRASSAADPPPSTGWSASLKRELAENRTGYFRDLTTLRADGGKPRPAPEHLAAVAESPRWPAEALSLLDAAGEPLALPLPAAVLLLFRAGAEPAAASWAAQLSQLEAAGLPCLHLSLVESRLFALPGLRHLLLRSAAKPALACGAGSRALSFGDAEPLRSTLRLQNRLTAHLALVDARGSVRWVASGAATAAEEEALLRCGRALLHESATGSSAGGKPVR